MLESITIHRISIILQGMMVGNHGVCITCIHQSPLPTPVEASRNNDDLWQIAFNFLLFCNGAIQPSIASDAEKSMRLFL